MKTNTTEYEFSHGKKPKGNGRWFLELIGTDGNGRYTTYEAQVNGSLGEAKKQAVKQFKAEVGGVKKITEIKVLP